VDLALVIVPTAGEQVLEMEAFYAGLGGLPPDHYRPRQDEHFEVLEGAAKAVENGELCRGDRFDIPASTGRQVVGDGARVHWEVRPALRMADFFEIAYSGNARPRLQRQVRRGIPADDVVVTSDRGDHSFAARRRVCVGHRRRLGSCLGPGTTARQARSRWAPDACPPYDHQA